VLVGHHLGDRRRQRGLAMVDVTDGPDVDVRLVANELFFAHDFAIPVCVCVRGVETRSPG
jgi:hypothetical protein